MAQIKLKLESKKKIVLFQFLYSQNLHLGWSRSDSLNPEFMTIYTTDDLIKKNIEILEKIDNYVSLSLL